MYIEKKRIGKNVYNYLKVSIRANDKVATKTIAYLGKEPMTKKQINAKIKEISGSSIEKIKRDTMEKLKESADINNEFLKEKQIEMLDQMKKEFGKKQKMPDKKMLSDMFRDFKTFYIYNTNSIEGNTLTLEETNLLLNENKTPQSKDLKEIYDHLNERETFDFIIQEKPKIDKESIIKMHSMLLKNIDERIGRFRLHEVRVFGASFDTSPSKFVDADMSILVKWHNKNKSRLHPLVLAAIFHEKFERIHPFYDGNGRTGRMLSNMILIQNGFPPLIVENKRRKEYYDVLSVAHKAELAGIDIKLHKPIVAFFYDELLLAYEKIFSKWG